MCLGGKVFLSNLQDQRSSILILVAVVADLRSDWSSPFSSSTTVILIWVVKNSTYSNPLVKLILGLAEDAGSGEQAALFEKSVSFFNVLGLFIEFSNVLILIEFRIAEQEGPSFCIS